jgi:hypothetical protein
MTYGDRKQSAEENGYLNVKETRNSINCALYVGLLTRLS